jgi:hypothetical protein
VTAGVGVAAGMGVEQATTMREASNGIAVCLMIESFRVVKMSRSKR